MTRLTLIFILLVFTALVAGVLFRHRMDEPDALPHFPSAPPPSFDPMPASEGNAQLMLRIVGPDGQPAPSAAVALRSGGFPAWAFADDEGRVHFEHLVEGACELAVLAWPHPPLETTVEAHANDAVEKTVTLAPVNDPPPPLPDIARAPLRGTLQHRLGGDPSEYDVLFLPRDPPERFGGAVPRRASVDAAGAFAIEDLALARYRIAIVPAWARGSTWPDLASRERVELDHRAAIDIGALAIEAGAIEGEVRDDQGLPLEGALVLLSPALDESRPWPPHATDEQGRFRIDDLPPGEYRVAVRAGEGQSSAPSVAVEAGKVAVATMPPLQPRKPAESK